MLIHLLHDHLHHKAGSVLDLDPADAQFLIAGDRTRPGTVAPPPAPDSFSHFLYALVTGKALSTTAGPSGGYLVPVEHSTRIFNLAASVSLVRPRAAIIPMHSREVEVSLPDTSTPANAADSPLLSAVTVRWNPEKSVTPEAPPALKQARLTDHSLVGYTATAASLASASADAVLTSLFASALAWHSDRAFLRGSGVGQPLGILTWAGLITVTRSAASAVAPADLAGMYARLLPPTDPSRVIWAIHPTALAPMLTACSSLITAPRPSSSPLSPFQVLGHDAFVTDKLPLLNTPGDVLLADLSRYLLGDRQELEIAHSSHIGFLGHQHCWRFSTRCAGQPWPRDKVTLADTTSLSPFVALAAG